MKNNLSQNKHLRLFSKKEEGFFLTILAFIFIFGFGVVYWEGKNNQREGSNFYLLAFDSLEPAYYFKAEKKIKQSEFFFENHSDKTIFCKISLTIEKDAQENLPLGFFSEEIKSQEKKSFSFPKIEDENLAMYFSIFEKINPSQQDHLISITANCENQKYQIEKPLKIPN